MTVRPEYRRNMSPSTERKKLGENHNTDSKNGRENSYRSKLITEKSTTLKWEIQQYKPMQVRTRTYVRYLFDLLGTLSCELRGYELFVFMSHRYGTGFLNLAR